MIVASQHSEGTGPSLNERCTFWLRGRQCGGYRLPDTNRCAMHAKPKNERGARMSS